MYLFLLSIYNFSGLYEEQDINKHDSMEEQLHVNYKKMKNTMKSASTYYLTSVKLSNGYPRRAMMTAIGKPVKSDRKAVAMTRNSQKELLHRSQMNSIYNHNNQTCDKR